MVKMNSTKSAWKNQLVSTEIARLKGLSKRLGDIDNLTAVAYMRAFDRVAKKHGFKAQKLRFGRTVYLLGQGQHRVFFNSGIHGEERAGPVALLHFLETTDKGKLIGNNVSLMISPLVGHDAWNNKNREEDGRINLNSVWISKNEKNAEFKYDRVRPPKYITDIRKEVIKFDPTLFLDFHEDSTIEDNEPYLWRNRKNRGHIYDLQKAIGVSRRKGIWDVDCDNKTTAETFVYELGCRETSTVETPQTKSLKQRVAFNLAIIRWLFRTLHQSHGKTQ